MTHFKYLNELSIKKCNNQSNAIYVSQQHPIMNYYHNLPFLFTENFPQVDKYVLYLHGWQMWGFQL